VFSAGAYFIGKAVWGKGFSELLDLAKHYDDTMATCAPGEPKLHWDIFGAGPDLPAIRARAAKYQVDAAFLGACDHLDPSLKAYRCVLPGYSAFSLRVFSVLPGCASPVTNGRAVQMLREPVAVGCGRHHHRRGAGDGQVGGGGAAPRERLLRRLRQLPHLRVAGGVRAVPAARGGARPGAHGRGRAAAPHVGGSYAALPRLCDHRAA
jgi:hypothetical protein